MKKKKLDLPTVVAIASLVISTVSLVWVGGFRMSALIHDVQDLKDDMKEVKQDIKEIKDDLHKLDVRVNILEQRNK